MADSNKLRWSRHVVNRIIKRWGLQDNQRPAVALDRFMEGAEPATQQPFTPIKTACELLPQKPLLKTQRISRHFELICKKMKTHLHHVCDPGPFILAPGLM